MGCSGLAGAFFCRAGLGGSDVAPLGESRPWLWVGPGLGACVGLALGLGVSGGLASRAADCWDCCMRTGELWTWWMTTGEEGITSDLMVELWGSGRAGVGPGLAAAGGASRGVSDSGATAGLSSSGAAFNEALAVGSEPF